MCANDRQFCVSVNFLVNSINESVKLMFNIDGNLGMKDNHSNTNDYLNFFLLSFHWFSMFGIHFLLFSYFVFAFDFVLIIESYIYKTSGFDYRPFVLNWCMTVKVIDGFVVNPIESLKAEWLYSQGRGRQFRVGEQVELARYLSSVCPMTGETLENEDERKLRLILSKAQQHQRQLQEEISGMVYSLCASLQYISFFYKHSQTDTLTYTYLRT